jgi:hypothetical protein
MATTGYVLLISEDKLKESTAINGNVDVDYLLPYVRVAQKKYSETKIGTKNFTFIQSLIKNGTITNVGNKVWKDLVDDWIADALVHWAFFECLPFLRYKIQNGNIFSKTSETGSALSRTEAQDLREEIRNTAEFYTERLINFICCSQDFYGINENTEGLGCDKNEANTNAFYNGMNLENGNKCENC